MMQKECLVCKKISYSSGDSYSWFCPYCGTDMTRQKAIPAQHEASLIRSEGMYPFLLRDVKLDTSC
ncbi:hypothetical protein [Brevibacillus brevis]|uniref:Uncharacterized protein n=1 Tax=Brevibacillus brevis TaxID=1393 RepID=A0A517IC65_BREBE|nr:hypothetical protein [Brevibacillus brevis]QDS36463.1 hypothetical protein FPS98_22060 [Brevibacillus brevis]